MDATADIIKEAGAVYVKPDKLPQGWKGKPWACQNGARAARGDVLLFIDADVRLSETAVESLSAEFLKKGKPVSVQPYHTVKKQHEYFSLFFNVIQLCVTGMSLFKGKKTGFYGPLLMIKKELFDEHEGYEAVKNEVVEDFKLGIFYNRKGTEIELLMGERQVSFRMYKNSFASLFEGWTKNFSSGSISMKWWLLLLVFAWVSFLTALPIEIINTALNAYTAELIILCVLYVLTVALIYRAAHKMGSYPLIVCIIYPVYLVMFHVIFIYSIFATFILKTTTWKGRKL